MYQKKNHKIKTEMKLEIKEQRRDFTWFDEIPLPPRDNKRVSLLLEINEFQALTISPSSKHTSEKRISKGFFFQKIK